MSKAKPRPRKKKSAPRAPVTRWTTAFQSEIIEKVIAPKIRGALATSGATSISALRIAFNTNHGLDISSATMSDWCKAIGITTVRNLSLTPGLVERPMVPPDKKEMPSNPMYPAADEFPDPTLTEGAPAFFDNLPSDYVAPVPRGESAFPSSDI